ncbi:MAG: DUF3341 domain-containing protein [Phycisphaerales bacterium]|nr:MAG: DUF3341 domain-containing protein [Phycisphaerales bacterium]
MSIVSGIADYFPFVVRKPPARFRTEDDRPVHGIMAEYDSAADVYHAAEQVRDAGYTKWDVYTPYPIHGMEHAMGVKRTFLPLVVAGGGFTGVGLGFLMQWWISGVDYPLMKQGKPYAAWEPFVMVSFELGILFAAFTALFGMLALNGLPRWHHPLMLKERFLRASDDRFIIVIEAEDKKFDPDATVKLLEDAGSSRVDLVEDE